MSIANDMWNEHKVDMFWNHQDSIGSTDRRPYRTEVANFGYIWLSKIVNKTSENVRFYNPWKDDFGNIEAGKSEFNLCRGYIPLLESPSKPYEITYYDQVLEKKNMEIVDNSRGDWLLCIQEASGFYRHNWDVRPPHGRAFSELELTIAESGYEIFSIYGKWVKGQHISWG